MPTPGKEYQMKCIWQNQNRPVFTGPFDFLLWNGMSSKFDRIAFRATYRYPPLGDFEFKETTVPKLNIKFIKDKH